MKGMRRSRIASLCLVVMGLLLVMAGGVLQAQGPEEPPDSVGAPLVVQAVTPVTNPPLVESCGLDIVLVIDGSGSIDDTEYGQMQAALVAFVNALLPATPTQFALVEFASAAVVRQVFTGDKTTIINEINQNRAQPEGSNTNWEQGLLLSHDLFPKRPDNPDLVVFASDGNPNYKGDPPQWATDAVDAAVVEANDIKNDGIRIIAIGIGDYLDTDNLIAISSADAVYTGGFDELAGIFAELAIELCGGTITVYKVVGDVSSGDLVAGWTFGAGVSGGDASPGADTTGTDGSVVFDISIDDGSATVGIAETVKAGYALVSAVCSGATDTGTFYPETNSVGGIVISRFDIASCTFTNILCADCTIETDSPVCAGSENAATGPEGMSSYTWTVTGGTLDSGQGTDTLTYVAGTGATLTVDLTIVDANGCKSSCQKLVTVDPNPVATATNTGPVCVGKTLALIGGPDGMSSYSWSGPNSFASSDQSPTVSSSATLAMAGTYTLSVTDLNGCTDEAQTTVAVNEPPQASFTVSIDHATLTVSFDGSASDAGDPGSPMKSWAWDFGDGTFGAGETTSHTYAQPGHRTVRLMVTNQGDCIASTTQDIMVGEELAVYFADAQVCYGADVTLVPVVGGGVPPYSYLWTFDDGAGGTATSTDELPVFPYDAPGTYNVTLKVTDSEESEATANGSVTIWANPVAAFTAVPASGVAPLTVQFTDKTSGGTPPYTYAWDFGEGDPSSSKDPTHEYASAGAYTVVLMVTDEHGCTDSHATAVTVTRPELAIEKTGDAGPVSIGDTVSYNIRVTNSGDVTLHNVTVVDAKLGIDKLIGLVAPGATAQVFGSYGPLQDIDLGWLDNTAIASSDQAGPVEAKWSVWVVEAEAPPALLSIEKTGDAGPLSVGDTINYTIKVINSGDAILTNVVVNDTKLGIIDLNIGDLDPGDTYEITASYGPLEESDVGFVDNTASAESDQTEPVEDSWRVQVVEPEQPPETPTPTPIPCIRSDIDVIVYGKIPVEVDMYVAGDLYHSQQTAVNAFGEQQATFSVWPGAGETYAVSMTPRLPGYLDPDGWTFQLIEGSLSMRIPRCVHREVILQLLHAGPSVTPTPAPTLPVEELPVTGVPVPTSSFGGRLLKVLGFLLIGSGGLFYWTSRRD